MTKKKGILDFHIEFNDDDLRELFEPFNPPKNDNDNPQNKYPIVLAHGFARPDFLIDSLFTTLNLSIYDFSFVSDRFHYFKGIASHLKKNGFDTYHCRVSWAADVKTRAKDLTAEIGKILNDTGQKKVHIIGHSMGGLDARHMIVNENMADKVCSLTTIGTPHLGSIIADFVLEQGADKIIGILKNFMNMEGIHSLTTRECYNFNKYASEIEAENDVVYQVFYSSKDYKETFLPFQPTWKMLDRYEGANDGLVSIKSQKWTTEIKSRYKTKKIKHKKFPIEADHFDQIGWWNLNEFHKAGWWNMSALHDKNKHEEIIKNVYLRIAKDIMSLA